MLKLTARWETRVFLAVFLVGLAFAAFTQHAWEDFFIVLRQAENLSRGHGLVYTPGEKVQSFTSPLGILIPAAIAWITGATTYEPGRNLVMANQAYLILRRKDLPTAEPATP